MIDNGNADLAALRDLVAARTPVRVWRAPYHAGDPPMFLAGVLTSADPYDHDPGFAVHLRGATFSTNLTLERDHPWCITPDEGETR